MKDLKEQKSIRRFNKDADATLQVIEERQVLNKEFRVYGTPEEPLFLAKDVAEWIEHSQVSRMIQNIDKDEKVVSIVHTLGGNQEAWFLKEDGLYEVLMQSRKPIAKGCLRERQAERLQGQTVLRTQAIQLMLLQRDNSILLINSEDWKSRRCTMSHFRKRRK